LVSVIMHSSIWVPSLLVESEIRSRLARSIRPPSSSELLSALLRIQRILSRVAIKKKL
jgi:hypothetical protein